MSVLSIQSPGSDGSGSQPSPSFAVRKVPRPCRSSGRSPGRRNRSPAAAGPPAPSLGAQQIGMIEANAGIDVGDHDAGAAGGDAPGVDRIGGRQILVVYALHGDEPSASACPGTTGRSHARGRHEQRIIRHVGSERVAELVHVREFHRRVGAQLLERGVDVRAIERLRQKQDVHARRDLARASRPHAGALRQSLRHRPASFAPA